MENSTSKHIEIDESSLVGKTSNQMIIFSVGEQEYCVPILSIKEIREHEKPTLLPHCPDYIEGAINIRGNIITVVNLATYLSIPMDDNNERKVVIVIEDQNRDTTCGLLASEVIGITEILSEDIQPIDVDNGSPELDGLVNVKDRIVRILNLKSVIRDVLGDRKQDKE